MPLLHRNSLSELPDWLKAYTAQAAQAARNLTLNPDSRGVHSLSSIPYKGERFSPVNSLESAALGKNIEENPLYRSTAEAYNLLDRANTRLPTGIAPYYSPYTQDLANSIANQSHRTFSEDILPSLEGKFVRLGQYGGREHQLASSRAARDLQKDIAANQLEALENQYNQAAQGFNQDQARLLEAAQAEYERGNILNSVRSSDINMLLQGGAYQRALEERHLQVAEEDYRRAQRHPYDTLNFLIGALQGAPIPTMMRENINIPAAPKPPASLRSSDYAGLMAQLAPALIGQRGFGRSRR